MPITRPVQRIPAEDQFVAMRRVAVALATLEYFWMPMSVRMMSAKLRAPGTPSQPATDAGTMYARFGVTACEPMPGADDMMDDDEKPGDGEDDSQRADDTLPREVVRGEGARLLENHLRTGLVDDPAALDRLNQLSPLPTDHQANGVLAISVGMFEEVA